MNRSANKFIFLDLCLGIKKNHTLIKAIFNTKARNKS